VIDVAQCWRILPVDQASILEIRAIWPKGIECGQKKTSVFDHFYSSDFESVEDLKFAFERKAEALNNAGYNVYTPLNRIARVEPGYAVKDDDISKIQLLLIDIDRTSNTSCPATDTEVEAAKQLGQKIIGFLATQGWPHPKQVMSGNGWHLLYPMDNLDATKEAKNFVKGVLVALAIKFDNDVVCVDRNVFNPSRITKVPGTLARKGQATEERPYRIASVFNG
jgi:hypothetical protein